MTWPLLLSVFVIATCGLVYELVAGALASYLLGDSVTQFSTVIGVYLFAMGMGSYLSRFVRGNLLAMFVQVELLVALVGGSSGALLFWAFELAAGFRVLLYGLVFLTGVLVGLEIPLLMRVLKDRLRFEELVSQVFTFDYVGALLASLLFPLLLVPRLGLVRTALLFGLLNALVALWTVQLLGGRTGWARLARGAALAVLALLGGGMAVADRLVTWAEADNYPGRIVHAESSPYQRIVLTRTGTDLALFLNGNLQFDGRDEYRYHEALVHPGLAALAEPRRVLVLGGGDGLALREILRHAAVDAVTLVDLDPAITRLFSRQPELVALNGGALRSPRVRVINADAFRWLREHSGRYDFIVVDFPDPSNFSLGKLYTDRFYRTLRTHLAPGGRIAVQGTSPYAAPKSFRCILNTIEAAGLHATPYHAWVPSFGEWGFVLAGHGPYRLPSRLPEGLRWLSAELLPSLFVFPPDLLAETDAVNRLDNQILVHLFEAEWAAFYR